MHEIVLSTSGTEIVILTQSQLHNLLLTEMMKQPIYLEVYNILGT